RWQERSDRLDASSRLKAGGSSSLLYKADQITIVPSDRIQGCRSQIRDPNLLQDRVFSTGRACKQYFQMSILLVQPDVQSLHFQQADQKHPNPSVAAQFHLLSDGNG